MAVVTEWLISHHCSLRFENLFLAIEIHVVFWKGRIFMFGTCSSGGLLIGLYFFLSWSNNISGGGFIRRFLTRWGFTLPFYLSTFSDSC